MEAAAMAGVSVATGALAPVLVKLIALLDDDERYKLTEGTRSDAMLMRSQLEAVHSLLPMIWGRKLGDGIDGVCKDETMAEVRELSYDMDDAIDDFLELSMVPSGNNGDSSIQRSTSPFDELKTGVEDVSKRFSEKWRPLVELDKQVQPFPTAASVDRRARLFLHEDSSDSGLVGMDKHIEELIKLLEQGADIRSSSDASGWRNGRPHFSTRTKPIRRKFVIKVAMSNETIQRKQVLQLATEDQEVEWTKIMDDRLVVIGDGVDIMTLMNKLRMKVGYVDLVEFRYINEIVEATMPPAANDSIEFQEVKTVCVLGLPGGGKTTIARILYHSLREKFQCRAIVSASPGPGHKMMDILAEILTGVTNVPYAANGTLLEQDLIDTITNFLVDKRYLVIIDDIWHWESWEIIRKSLPKNNLGTRIIMTTRFNSIAKKCQKDENNGAFVYEIGALDSVDAWRLSNSTIERSLPTNTDINLMSGTIKDNPCSNIVDMCYCMPLALNCISSALAEKIQELGNDVPQRWRALRLVEDGILHIPSLKPLAKSLSLGYDDLPFYLRTFLLYSGVYHWRDRLERGHLIRRWMGEGFVSEEKAAEGYFDELVDREWIKQLVGSSDYEIHPMMLAFLRCKSKEFNFITCLGEGSDTASTSSRRIRRLSLQRGYPVDCFSSMDVSRTRSLVVLGDVKGIPFNQFERLRMLDLEGNKDILNSHLQDICECEQLSFRLSYLCLKGTGITKLPREIGKLKHLEILYVGNTKISDLPQEIGELKHLQTLDVGGTDIRELPPQIGELNNLRTLDVRNTRVRELPWQAGQISESLRVLLGDKSDSVQVQVPEGVNKDLVKHRSIPELANSTLSIAILDGFGPPLVGTFKVLGRNVRIPELIKAHFKVLSSLDIGLCKLDEQDHDFLAKMPNLRALVLRFEALLPRKSIPIGGRAAGDPTSEGFAKLERFRVDSRVPRITFQEEAMPKLKLLEFKFHAGLPSNDPVRITNLRSLQKVVFRCSPWYKIDAPGISASIAVVKKEAKEHRNRISLVVDTGGKEEILIEERKSSQDVAGSSTTGTTWVYTETAQHDNLPPVRDDYKGKGILDGRCPTCGRPTD